jgi:hypothetical protein
MSFSFWLERLQVLDALYLTELWQGIIAKLPTSWRDFATGLKRKSEDISIESLVTALNMEEKSRAKDAPSTSTVVETSANVFVNKNNHNNKN